VAAAGPAPTATLLGDIVERDVLTIDADLPLEQGFRILEDEDCERAPVVDGGRLVGVLSRSSLRRRLAEDEPPPAVDGDDPGTAV
jgi:CBS domain-containing protein